MFLLLATRTEHLISFFVCSLSTPQEIPGAEPVKVFYMRTLLEQDMNLFFPDYAWRTLLLDQVRFQCN
jgi:hypothetical protein